MNQQVQLSVIVPVYNGCEFLRETLDSILKNSEQFSVECLVIDDGSTDLTPQIIESYGDQIRHFRQENAGEGVAVNRGLSEAIGELILVVSADDPVLTPKLFLGVFDFFETHPDVVAWYPDWNVIDINGEVVKTVQLPEYDFKDLFSRNRVLPGPGTWFRKKEALSINGRNEKWKYVGDYDFWLRLSNKGLLSHRKEVLAQWRRHPHSTSISERGIEMAQERIEVIEQFVKENLGSLSRDSISLARAHAHYLAARLGFFSKAVDSRKLILRAIQINPRIVFEIKPYEILFMSTFPISKIVLDTFLKWRG